jgi:N-acetylmuramoyl-L-alanine amidase
MKQAAPAWSLPARRWARLAACLLAALLLLPGSPSAVRADEQPIDGNAYRPFSDIAALYGMKITWVAPAQTLDAQNQYCTIEATVSDRILRLNGEPLALGFPIVARQGMLYLAKSDFENNIFPLLSPAQIPPPVPALHRIVIDPGHGGVDPGTQNAALNTSEKINTLDTGLRVALELQKRGYEVFLTRKTDVKIELTDRPALANQAKADLFISIHFNDAPQTGVTGVETWILPPPGQPTSFEDKPTASEQTALPGNRFDAWNAIAAYSVQRAVAGELDSANRGVKRAHDRVLVGLNMPGMLVECGFLSNPVEGGKIITGDYHQKIAVAIADGVDSYKATLDRLRPKPPAASVAPATVAPTASASASAQK